MIIVGKCAEKDCPFGVPQRYLYCKKHFDKNDKLENGNGFLSSTDIQELKDRLEHRLKNIEDLPVILKEYYQEMLDTINTFLSWEKSDRRRQKEPSNKTKRKGSND